MTDPTATVVPGTTPGAAAPALTVTVRGHRPAPQGSKRHIGHGRMVEQSKRVKPWREAVRDAARAAMQPEPFGELVSRRPPLDGPLSVDAVFTVVKPASAPKRRITWPITRHSGDLDKILRSTFDALTDGWAIADDSRIVEVTACKVYPGEGPDALGEPGAVIRIWLLGGAS